MNLFEETVTQLITEELSKRDIESIINSKVDSKLGSKDFEKKVKKIASDVLDEFFKILYQRNNFWKSSVQR